MNKRLASVCFVAWAALWTGCVAEDDTWIETMYVCAPAEDAAACAPDGECERFLTGTAYMYLQADEGAGAYNNGMFFFMQVANNRLPNDNAPAGQANSANARITDYVLSYEGPNLTTGEYTYSAITVTIPAESVATPYVALIPPEVSLSLQAIIPLGETWPIDVLVRFKGEFLDGSTFETGPFKVATYVTNAVFDISMYPCTNPTDVVTTVCPNIGQSSSWKCEAPPGP